MYVPDTGTVSDRCPMIAYLSFCLLSGEMEGCE